MKKELRPTRESTTSSTISEGGGPEDVLLVPLSRQTPRVRAAKPVPACRCTIITTFLFQQHQLEKPIEKP
jgi:hypothetical protein